MLLLRRVRVPAILLPPELGAGADPLEPVVLCDLRIEGRTIASVARSGTDAAGPDGALLDLGGSLAFPGFVDVHSHLDKAHTWFRAPNRSGTFAEALATLARDREKWTASDLRLRADFALRCAWEHGTRALRTHIDTGLPWGETSHGVMAELREAWRGRIELQTVPLCAGADYAGPQGEALANLALRHGASALGGFLIMSSDLPSQIDRLLALAADRGCGVDLHVDENGNPHAEVLRAVAEGALRRQFRGPIVCGHCCSLAVQPTDRQRSTLALVREAGIAVVALPLCNLYLQDRRPDGFPRTPFWRGLTLVHDLLDAGVPVACASDNVRDAFHAYGDLDMAEVYQQSVRLAHLDASRLAGSAAVATSTPADLMGLPGHGRVAPGAAAHLVVFPVRSFSEFLSRPAGPRRLIDGETVRDAAPPPYSELAAAGFVPAE